ncbi:unnamed protein product, partial [Discosporangium mesarthrocarpum]
MTQHVALDPEKYISFKLAEKKVVSHDTRLFRFALQTPSHILGLPIGQHISLKYDDPTTGKPVMRSYTPTSSDEDVGYVDFIVKIYFPNVEPKFPDGGQMSMHLETRKVCVWGGLVVLLQFRAGALGYVALGQF